MVDGLIKFLDLDFAGKFKVIRRLWRRLLYGARVFDLTAYDRPLPVATVRCYCEADFDACSALYEQIDDGRFPDGHLADFQAYLRKDGVLIMVLEQDGVVFATGGVSVSTGTYTGRALLSYGLVAPDKQGQGYGVLLLLLRLAVLADTQGVWSIQMSSVGQGTESFYVNRGFRDMGVKGGACKLAIYEMNLFSEDIPGIRALLDTSDIIPPV